MVSCLSPREPALGTRLALSVGVGGGPGGLRAIQPVQVQAFRWAAVAVSMLPTALPALLDPCPGSDILPNSMTASWSCGGPRLPVELIRPSAGGSCIQAPRCPASASPPGVKGKRASGRAALVGARCRLRDCMRLGIGRGTGVCSLRPVVAPGPSLRSSEVQFGRPLSPFTSGGPDGAHYILFGCKTWRSENP